MEQYPTLHFLMRHGPLLSYAAAAICTGGGIWATIALGGWGYSVAGVIIGAIAYALVRSYVELITLVTDMLLPK